MRSGSVVRFKSTGDIGIVIAQYKDVLKVLNEDYNTLYVSEEKVEITGKFFDLSIIWEVVKHEDKNHRNRMYGRGIKAE